MQTHIRKQIHGLCPKKDLRLLTKMHIIQEVVNQSGENKTERFKKKKKKPK